MLRRLVDHGRRRDRRLQRGPGPRAVVSSRMMPCSVATGRSAGAAASRLAIHRVLCVLLLVCCSAAPAGALTAHAQEVAPPLPVVDIEVDPATLERLLAYPYSGEEAAARIGIDSVFYDCRIRLRGGTSIALPKPSWRIELASDENVFGARVLILRAEYRDASYMRNYLVHGLFRRLGFLAPDAQFLNLRMNGEPAGVYLEVERIDNDFLAARGLPKGDLFSLVLNAGRWYPYMHRSDHLFGWEGRTLTAGAHERIERALMRMGYTTYEDFPEHVEALFDVDEVLSYYAIIYAVYGADAVVDNYYVYRHPETGQFTFIPWDMDATLGLAWDGAYVEEFETKTDWYHLTSVLLQRLLEYPAWQATFAEKLALVIGPGFDFLQEELVATADRIRDDVAADSSKPDPGPAFELAVEQISQFLDRRRAALTDHEPFHRIRAGDLRVSNPFPTADDPFVTVEAFSAEPQDMQLWLPYDIQIAEWSATHRERLVQLYDDGTHDDSVAGDGWYTATLDLSPHLGDIVPVGVLAGRFYAPAASRYNAYYRMSATNTFNLKSGGADDYQAVRFESVTRAGGDAYVVLRNTGEAELDLSSFFFQSGAYYQKVVIPWGTVLSPDQQLVIASNVAGGSARFPDAAVVGGLAFEPVETDTLRLLSPMHTLVSESVAQAERADLPRVVINEINYHSHDSTDTGDWIELHNPTAESIPIGGWQVRDGDDDHVFALPLDAELPPNGFAVVAEDQERLKAHATVEVPVYGDADFAFDAAGELVRLHNAHGELVDAVAYGDDDPWPNEADGGGFTLELLEPELDTALPESWAASDVAGGTPGRTNSVFTATEPRPQPAAFVLRGLFPNPAREVVAVEFDLHRNAEVSLVLFDVLGRQLARETSVQDAGARRRISLELSNYAAGMYFIAVEVDGQRAATRGVAHVR